MVLFLICLGNIEIKLTIGDGSLEIKRESKIYIVVLFIINSAIQCVPSFDSLSKFITIDAGYTFIVDGILSEAKQPMKYFLVT